MNIMSFLFGDVAGASTDLLAQKILKPQVANKAAPFINALKDSIGQHSADKLNIADLDLSRSEEADILELRNIALNKGLAEVDINIHGTHYKMSTNDLSLVTEV